MKLDYDTNADVLYITFGAKDGPAEYLENGAGQIILVNPRDRSVVGCTVPMFSRRVSNGELDIPEIGVVLGTSATDQLIEQTRTAGRPPAQ